MAILPAQGQSPLSTSVAEKQTQKMEQDASQAQPASAKSAHNRSILQASLEVSISAGNDSLALLYRTAIDQLNMVLEADFGPKPIERTYDISLDISPAATAERIVTLSTAFFGSYQEQHPEMDQQTAATSFLDVISGGIDQGFAEAREILDGLQVLEGDIAANIDATYSLVQEGLTAFLEANS